MPESDHKEFSTTNLGCASYLVASRKLRLLRVELNDRGQAHFLFADEHGQGSAIESEYVTGAAMVSAAEFHRQLRVLRRLIEEERGRNNRKGGNRFRGYKDEYSPVS